MKQLFSADLMQYGWVIDQLVLAAGSEYPKERNVAEVVFSSWLIDEEKTVGSDKLQFMLQGLANGNDRSRMVLSHVLSLIDMDKYGEDVKTFFSSLLKSDIQPKVALEILQSSAVALVSVRFLSQKARIEIVIHCLVEAVKVNPGAIGTPLFSYASNSQLRRYLEIALFQLMQDENTRGFAEKCLDGYVEDVNTAWTVRQVLFYLLKKESTCDLGVGYLKNYLASDVFGKPQIAIGVLIALIRNKETCDLGVFLLKTHVIFNVECEWQYVVSKVLKSLTDLPEDLDIEIDGGVEMGRYTRPFAEVLFVLMQDEKTLRLGVDSLKKCANSDGSRGRSFAARVCCLLWEKDPSVLRFQQFVRTGLFHLVLQDGATRQSGFKLLDEYIRAEDKNKNNAAVNAFVSFVIDEQKRPVVYSFLKQTNKWNDTGRENDPLEDQSLTSMLSTAIRALAVRAYA